MAISPARAAAALKKVHAGHLSRRLERACVVSLVLSLCSQLNSQVALPTYNSVLALWGLFVSYSRSGPATFGLNCFLGLSFLLDITFLSLWSSGHGESAVLSRDDESTATATTGFSVSMMILNLVIKISIIYYATHLYAVLSPAPAPPSTAAAAALAAVASPGSAAKRGGSRRPGRSSSRSHGSGEGYHRSTFLSPKTPSSVRQRRSGNSATPVATPPHSTHSSGLRSPSEEPPRGAVDGGGEFKVDRTPTSQRGGSASPFERSASSLLAESKDGGVGGGDGVVGSDDKAATGVTAGAKVDAQASVGATSNSKGGATGADPVASVPARLPSGPPPMVPALRLQGAPGAPSAVDERGAVL